MKTNLLTVALAGICAIFGICSCQAKQAKEEMNKEGKKLVVYFSHTGENYNVGVIEKGNTHIIADMIADETGADRFEIEPEKRYPRNYNECIDVAKKELNANARPAV
ncbi:MAG: flavodoxin, partial [Prevotella sp.]|nr:flavodoxin [Prevotella sp.]